MLVWILGAAGLTAIAWLIASWVFGLQLVILTTGSMSPTMPAGSGVIVRTVDAAELATGDVVTVARAHDMRLVTHRIVDIAPADRETARTLTLQGDANETVDAEPYVVTQAQVAIVAVPGLGTVITFFTSPAGITALAVVIPLAVLWVLWPSKRSEREEETS